MEKDAKHGLPLVCGDTVEQTYNELKEENPDMSGREAWELAVRIHKDMPAVQERIDEVGKILPFQQDDNWS